MTTAAVNPPTLRCPHCQGVLPAALFNAAEPTPCPLCASRLRVLVFPALYRPLAQGSAGESLTADTESGCYYHPRKRAVVPCDSCGRFLCALCDVEINDQHLCPGCVDTGKKQGRLAGLERERVLYDRMALMLAVLPVLIWPFTIITAPMTLYIAGRYWKAPRSLVTPSRVRFVAAIAVATLQLLGWSLFFYALLTGGA